VERELSKLDDAGSNPVSRSTISPVSNRAGTLTLVLSSLMSISCASLFPPGVPPVFTERAELPSCGAEVRGQGEPPDKNMRTCLLTAFEEQRPAELASTLRTVEGDPFSTYYRVWPEADIAVEVFTDSSLDRFRSAAWTYVACDAIAASEGHEVFELVGCSAPEVLVR
jgi:hypothetical protein